MVDINIVQKIVRDAAKLFADRTAVKQIKEKGACDFVTAVDEAVQSFVQEKLGELYPHIQFMGEEADHSDINMNGLMWVLDPVDGTANLIHDYHNSVISLALLDNCEVIMGIVYNPFLDEMFHAEKGKGSFLNGEPIYVSETKAMSESLFAIGTSPYFKDEADENFKLFARLFKEGQDIRRSGSAALDLVSVACGRIDGFLEKYLKIWDFAAGVLIVREAGGQVFDYNGNEFTMEMKGNVVAGNGNIAKILVEEYLS